jgi:hypothetical protein
MLPIPGLSSSACQSHVFPPLHSHSLLSIGQLCDRGCKAVFTNNCVTITFNDIVLLAVTRSTSTGGLWALDSIKPTTTLSVQTSIPITGSVKAMFHTTLARDTIANGITLYHASLFYPSLSTWCHAIDAGDFTTCTGLTSSAVRKYPPQSIPMHQGHLDQVRSNIRLTRLPTSNMQQPTTDADIVDDIAPPAEGTTRTRHVYTNCHCTTGMVYTDPAKNSLSPVYRATNVSSWFMNTTETTFTQNP